MDEKKEVKKILEREIRKKEKKPGDGNIRPSKKEEPGNGLSSKRRRVKPKK
ncbi:hypothetical protein KAI56_02280 [Candidatus Parcubacteria bacterium]|nr:hypothetical protein [Candidatus Parcubacteria bacterium]